MLYVFLKEKKKENFLKNTTNHHACISKGTDVNIISEKLDNWTCFMAFFKDDLATSQWLHLMYSLVCLPIKMNISNFYIKSFLVSLFLKVQQWSFIGSYLNCGKTVFCDVQSWFHRHFRGPVPCCWLAKRQKTRIIKQQIPWKYHIHFQ